jgi:hypothetical protein
MGETLNHKIDKEITLVETKLNKINEQIDQELFEHKESVVKVRQIGETALGLQ